MQRLRAWGERRLWSWDARDVRRRVAYWLRRRDRRVLIASGVVALAVIAGLAYLAANRTRTAHPGDSSRARLGADAAALTSDMAALASDVAGGGSSSFPSILRQSGGDLAASKASALTVQGEVGHVSSATVCGDAGVVTTQAGQAITDLDDIVAAHTDPTLGHGTIDSDVQRVLNDQAHVAADQQALPGVEIPGIPSADAVSAAIAAAQLQATRLRAQDAAAYARARAIIRSARQIGKRAAAICNRAVGA